MTLTEINMPKHFTLEFVTHVSLPITGQTLEVRKHAVSRVSVCQQQEQQQRRSDTSCRLRVICIDANATRKCEQAAIANR